jgi:hypothetical protein
MKNSRGPAARPVRPRAVSVTGRISATAISAPAKKSPPPAPPPIKVPPKRNLSKESSSGSTTESPSSVQMPRLPLENLSAPSIGHASASGRLEQVETPKAWQRPPCPVKRRHGVRNVTRVAWWKECNCYIYACGGGTGDDFCGVWWIEAARNPACSGCRKKTLEIQKHGSTWGYWCHTCNDFGH